jgi:hypothetical protein
VIGGVENSGYLSRTIAHHEMLHVAQFMSNPEIATRGLGGIVNEIIPSFIGTPEIYGGATTLGLGVAGAYFKKKSCP